MDFRACKLNSVYVHCSNETDLCTFGYLQININNSITFCFAFLLSYVSMGDFLLVVICVFLYVFN